MNALAALEPRRDSIPVLINFYGDDFLSEPKDDFELSQVISERFDNFPVDELQDLRTLLN